MKKLTSVAFILFLVFLLCSAKLPSARKMAAKEGEANPEMNKSRSKKFVMSTPGHSSSKMVGIEDCEKDTEEWLDRRIIAEAHLDYIYTQQHKH